ncbi:MAG: beta-galactosidase [Clostridia bacterium]|nr:beta-galactosidase [Clostridia bacterium]
MNTNLTCPRAEHPNPQWERKNWQNLNGEWMFEIDNSKSGEARGLQNAETLSGKITLPFCPESELSGVGNKDFMYCVWYKKVLTFTEQDLSGNRVLFHIGAADFDTKVWVGGKRVGLTHVGGSTPIDLDITAYLSVGENIVTVACYDDTRARRQPGGKQCMEYASHGCYYTRTTGIWQTVWYEIVPETYVKYAKMTPDLSNCSVSISVELSGTADLSAEVYYKGKKVGEAFKKNLSVTGQIEIALSEKHVWDVGDGQLYDVILRFGADEVKTYFGLRSIELKNGKFYLNGRPVFQRLILDQGFYPDGIWTAPTEEALLTDIKCSMSAGFNGARLHQKVFEPRFLYHCDREGYMVWGEYASWGIDHTDIANLSTFLPDWMAEIKRDYSHPAIIGWCPFNETWNWGPAQFAHQNDEFLRILYEQTKLADPTRPCIDTSGNFHVVTDIYDVHDYNQDPVTFKANYDKLVTDNELYDQVLRKNPCRQVWRGEPVFMSEYGGIGLQLPDNNGDRSKAWSYGRATHSLEEFYERYKGLTDALLDNPRMLGFCYTQLTDVEQEQNGLFTYEGRRPKFDLDVLYAINSRRAAIECED